MPEIRMTKDHIAGIRKRLDVLLKDPNQYRGRFSKIDRPFNYDKEVLDLCNLLRGSGIFNGRPEIPKPMRALRGHGRIKVVTNKGDNQ